jgi:hypothetical protein
MRRTDHSATERAGAGTADDSDPAGGSAPGLVDARSMGVFGYDTRDKMGGGDAVRVVVAARSAGRAARRIRRRTGFRVRRWTPPLAMLPGSEVEMARSAPGVVMWRSHDPKVAGQWFWLH